MLEAGAPSVPVQTWEVSLRPSCLCPLCLGRSSPSCYGPPPRRLRERVLQLGAYTGCWPPNPFKPAWLSHLLPFQ